MKRMKNHAECMKFLDAIDPSGKGILDQQDINVLAALVDMGIEFDVAVNQLIGYYEQMASAGLQIKVGDLIFQGLNDEHVRAINSLTEKIASQRQ